LQSDAVHPPYSRGTESPRLAGGVVRAPAPLQDHEGHSMGWATTAVPLVERPFPPAQGARNTGAITDDARRRPSVEAPSKVASPRVAAGGPRVGALAAPHDHAGAHSGGRPFASRGKRAIFDRRLVSDLVQVSQDGLTATHTDHSGEELFGVVFLDTALPVLSDGFYFELTLLSRRPGDHPDGLVLGVTTMLPDPQIEPALVADEVARSWSVGYNGSAHVDGLDDLVPVSWCPKDLQEGDSVGFLVTSSGEAREVVNGRVVATLPGRVPTDKPLFGFVDLLGSALAVRLQSVATHFASVHLA